MSEAQEPKPQKINRMDPAWAVFASAALSYYLNEDFGIMDRAHNAADHADIMLRERDRRDREDGK